MTRVKCDLVRSYIHFPRFDNDTIAIDMATRTARRAQYVPESIELPSIEAPQYVDSDGYEVDAETFALALNQTGTGDGAELVTEDVVKRDPEGDIGDGVEEQTDYADDDIAGADGELEEEIAIVEDGEEEPREPLLSLSDRCVDQPIVCQSRGSAHISQQCAQLLSHGFTSAPSEAPSPSHVLASTDTISFETSSTSTAQGHFPVAHTISARAPSPPARVPWSFSHFHTQ